MSLKYLLDTNVVSEPLKPRPSRTVLRNLTRHDREAAIATVVWHELRFGSARLPPSRRREAIERYLVDVVLASSPKIAIVEDFRCDEHDEFAIASGYILLLE